jgi:uncharacterized protein YjbI with pentapeptide repeats
MKLLKYISLVIFILPLHAEIEGVSSEENLIKTYIEKKTNNVKINFDLTGSSFNRWTFNNTIFTGSSEANTTFSYSTFSGTDGKITLFKGNINFSSFKGSTFTNVIFSGEIGDVSFENCILDNVTFKRNVSGIFNVTDQKLLKNKYSLNNVTFEKAVTATFTKAKLNKVKFEDNYEGSSFGGAQINNVTDKDGILLSLSLGKLKKPEAPKKEEKQNG